MTIAILLMGLVRFVFVDPVPVHQNMPKRLVVSESPPKQEIRVAKRAPVPLTEEDTLEWLAMEDVFSGDSIATVKKTIPHGPFQKSPFGVQKVSVPSSTSMGATGPLPSEKVVGTPAIAIIIDDVGMDRKHSREVVNLPSVVTLALLPYAEDIAGLASFARAQGHDVIIHMPMEPMDKTLNTGAIALRTGMDPAQCDAMLDRAFSAFEGYIGMNNHMGSRYTQNAEDMACVMRRLKEKGLFFVDSKTIGNSVGEQVAHSYGVPAIGRDVFLDHQETPAFVASALHRAEQVARQKGYAVVIGHPKAVTLAGLKAWIPEALARGYKLVPVRTLVRPAPAESNPDTVAVYGPAEQERLLP